MTPNFDQVIFDLKYAQIIRIETIMNSEIQIWNKFSKISTNGISNKLNSEAISLTPTEKGTNNNIKLE